MAWTRRAAVLTVSDRAAAGEREDRSGPLVARLLEEAGWEVPERRVVPDEREAIERALTELSDAGLALILTTGGTGVAPRDVTPDATRATYQANALKNLRLARYSSPREFGAGRGPDDYVASSRRVVI